MEQHLAAGIAVDAVADDANAEPLAGVDADLVGAAGQGAKLDQSPAIALAKLAPAGLRGLGAAIVGDPVYSRADDDELGAMVLPESGMLLHASRLVVPRERKDPIDATAPVPERFGRWLDYLS